MKPYIIRLHLKNLERPRDHKLPKAQEKLCAAPRSSHQNSPHEGLFANSVFQCSTYFIFFIVREHSKLIYSTHTYTASLFWGKITITFSYSF